MSWLNPVLVIEFTLYSLRIIYVIVLIAAMGLLFKEARRAFTKNVQAGDFNWFLFFGLAFNRAWFVWRGMIFVTPESRNIYSGSLLVVCYIFAIALELGVIRSHGWRK